MRILLWIAMAATLALATSASVKANVVAPSLTSELSPNKRIPYKIGGVFAFSGKVNFCVKESDFNEIIAVEKQGQDSSQLFMSKGGCKYGALPHLIMIRKVDEFIVNTVGQFWLVEAISLDGFSTFFIALPAWWFG